MDVNDPTELFGLRIQRTQPSRLLKIRWGFQLAVPTGWRHDVDADSVGNPSGSKLDANSCW